MVDMTVAIAVLTIFFGFLVLAAPKFLRILIGGYLILTGLIRLLGYLL